MKTVPATFQGPNGVEARWVVAENNRPGTTAWKIHGTPPGNIAGWADVTSASAGQSVTLYVTTDARSFRVDAYRMGWYHGAGGRLVWSSASVPGRQQPACPVAPVTNMVQCDNWAPSLRLTVGPQWVQGDYLLELVGAGGQLSYVPLTVTDPTSHATYLVKNDTFTWQLWNAYGGYDVYQGLGSCTPSYPPCNRATVLSYDRPYGYGNGAADFLGNELPFVQWAERRGLDVTYTTDVGVQQHPALLLRHRVLLSLGHDEGWSNTERLAALAAASRGVNVVFFGASPILRHVRLQASPLGPDRQLVDYRDSGQDPLYGTGQPMRVTGNWWGAPPSSWPPAQFVGEAYSGYLNPGAPAAPIRVGDPSSWLFQGTGLTAGSAIPGALVSDFDQYDPLMHPADLQILAHSPIPAYYSTSQQAAPASDITYWTQPASKAGIFDTGTVAWIPDLAKIPAISRMTGNLMALMGSGPAGLTQPSVANWSSAAG